MDAVVFEHVPVAELPEKWRAKLAKPGSALVTVRIEQEIQAHAADGFATDDPAFGIWRDHQGMSDVVAYVRKLRLSRYRRDGSRNGL